LAKLRQKLAQFSELRHYGAIATPICATHHVDNQ
jgi:hypothetical protein